MITFLKDCQYMLDSSKIAKQLWAEVKFDKFLKYPRKLWQNKNVPKYSNCTLKNSPKMVKFV